MKKVWCGNMPTICGYGLMVYGKSYEEASRLLKRQFYILRERYKLDQNMHSEFYTYDKAMDWFDGRVFEIKFGVRYDECNREF